ncbi:MAG: hypothetical protein HY260_10570 [Chloroflexi bacterium]|nr:hypothetical protein [Chloroflexota bacterium]
MNLQEYLEALDAKLKELAGVISASSVQREVDVALGTGFTKGRITFLDGSVLEFSEQLPTERQKYRIHHMDAESNLIVRWDSAPHHRELATFPFHKHTPSGVEAHPAINVLEALEQVVGKLNP